MNSTIPKKIGYILGVIAAIAVMLAMVVASWLVTCGIIYSITMVFGWTFSFVWSTVIWAGIVIIFTILPNKKTGGDGGELNDQSRS